MRKANPKAKAANFWKKIIRKAGGGNGQELSPEAEKSLFTSAYLFKKEKEKNRKLLIKLDSEYLQPHFSLYRSEINQIIQPKLSSTEFIKIEKLSSLRFFIAIAGVLKNKKSQFTNEERARCLHLLNLIKRIITLRSEMERSNDADKYYQLASGLTQTQWLFSHVYQLIEYLEKQLELTLKEKNELFFRNSLNKDKESPHEVLKTAFAILDLEAKEKILEGEQMRIYLRETLLEVSLQIAKEIKVWFKNTYTEFESNFSSNNDEEEAGGQGTKTAQASSSSSQPFPRMHIELDMKDLDKVAAKFKSLQERLTLNQLKQQALDFIN